jgi:hypothetical protein
MKRPFDRGEAAVDPEEATSGRTGNEHSRLGFDNAN